MVDCSHANSGREPARQEDVWRSVLAQRAGGTRSLMGLMLESNLLEGSQPFPRPRAELLPGLSITDPCLGWDATERLLREAHAALAPRADARAPAAAGRRSAAGRAARAAAASETNGSSPGRGPSDNAGGPGSAGARDARGTRPALASAGAAVPETPMSRILFVHDDPRLCERV